jgi:hypothetical protein
MSFSYDLDTAVGRVRLLIADTDLAEHDFSDEEIAVALEECDDHRRKAAAWLLMTLASNRARLAVSVKRGNLTEDLSKLAAELRAQAEALIEQEDAAAETPLAAIINPTTDRGAAARNYRLDRKGAVTEAP